MSPEIYEAIKKALELIVPMVIAIVFHEVAHGRVAQALGDPTAAQMNRLSLNPLRHVDPIGTVLLPGALRLMGLPVFGWAKPVPVVKERLRNPRRDMMLVAAAGPASNLVMALVGALLMGLVLRANADTHEVAGVSAFLFRNFQNFVLVNVFLALFNLLPVPPFDGSHIVSGLLPPTAAATYERLRPLGFPLLLVLLVVLPRVDPRLDLIGWLVMPVFEWVAGSYISLAAIVAGG